MSGFGLDHLPYGVFSVGDGARRVGVRYEDRVIDVASALGRPEFAAASLNPFLALGPAAWAEVREEVTPIAAAGEAAYALDEVDLHLPFEVADYVDFYASEHHAANVGKILRPDAEPLLPNYKHLPVGYHGRAGTVVVSGTPITRPSGQRKAPDEASPTYGPSGRLDLEAELGFVVGVGSDLSHPVACDDFDRHIFGVVGLNDWSARDIQAWEYVPLGPFLGKSFATSISHWVTPMAALEHAWTELPQQEPQPLSYLRPTEGPLRGLDLAVEVVLNGEVVSRPDYATMYWSPAQMLAHLTVNGASLRTGDLFASGTISGPEAGQRGSLLELTWGGTEPITGGFGERTFLEDGDEVTLRYSAPAAEGRLSLGEVTGRVVAAADQ